MAVATRVVTDALVVTPIALLNVTTKCRCSTHLDRAHDATLSGGQRRAMAVTISLTVAVEHIRHFRPRAGHRASAQKCCGGVGFDSTGIGCGSRSSGLDVEHTLLVAIRKYRAVVAKLRCPSSS